MSFWRRKKALKPSEGQIEIAKAQERFRARLEDINRTPNPDEKYLKLDNLRNEIQADINQKCRKISKLAQEKENSAFYNSNIAIFMTMGVLFAPTGIMIPFIFASFPGVYLGSAAIAEKVGKSAKERLEAENEEFFVLLKRQNEAVSLVMERIQKEREETLAERRHREDALKNLPGIKISFDDTSENKRGQKNVPPGPFKGQRPPTP